MPSRPLLAMLASAVVLLLLAALPLGSSSAALPSYCGAPPVDVSAASAPAGMDLRFLILTTRHGDRTPVGLYPGVNSNDVEWNCNLTQLSAIDTGNETKLQPGRLFRKRYLDGRQVLPGNCMFGQLTPKGREQHKALGNSLKQVYVDKYGFLNSQFSSEEIWVRSTDVPRTIASAQSLLFGMFPPSSTSADVPVFDLFSIDAWTDNMTPNTRLCPHLKQIYYELQQSPAWVAHLQEIAPLDAKIRSIFNLPANTSVDIIDAFDETYARICHGKPFPQGIDPLVQAIAVNSEFEMAYFYNQTRAASALGIGSFVGEQVARLDQAVNGQTGPLKLAYYSGHDTTLWPLSFAYGFGSIDYWPPYASHMEIELWQSRSAPRDHYVRFFFNGRPMPALGCSSPGPCPWETFRAAVSGVIPQHFAKQCSQPITPEAAASDLSSLLRLR